MHTITPTKFAYMYPHANQVLRSDDGKITAFKIESITGDEADTTICVKFWGYASLSLNEIIRKVTEHLQLCDGCHEDMVTCIDNEPRVHAHDGSYYCSSCYEIVLTNEQDAIDEQATQDWHRYHGLGVKIA